MEARVTATYPVKYPMQLEPVVREVVWGGRWLAEKLGRKGAEGAKLGESWEAFSGSVVVNGAWQGRTLGELFREHQAKWAGSAANSYAKFPLLVKFIDAHENLSIQVHPNDHLAQQLENYPFGKTEFWYVLEAQPDAHIYYGLNAPDISRADLKAALDNQDLLRYLSRVPVRAGDVVFMPAGTVHAITAGMVVYELQQDSDITYRLYDWGRTDREIHLEKGLQAIDATCANMRVTRPQIFHVGEAEKSILVSCTFFRSEIWRISRSLSLPARQESFSLLTAVAGSGRLNSPDDAFSPLPLATGDTLCIPMGLAYNLSASKHASEEGEALQVISSFLTGS